MCKSFPECPRSDRHSRHVRINEFGIMLTQRPHKVIIGFGLNIKSYRNAQSDLESLALRDPASHDAIQLVAAQHGLYQVIG